MPRRKDPQSELKEQLEEDENLLWTGQPKQGIVFRTSDIFMIPFSIIWFAFACSWMVGAFHFGGIFFIFGIPFVIIGLIFVLGRFLIDKTQRSKTSYGITENRVLIKSGIFSNSIKSINLKTLSDIELTEKSDGTGTIFVGPKNPYNFWGGGMDWWPGMKSSPQLELIPNARKVYQKIIEIQNSKSDSKV